MGEYWYVIAGLIIAILYGVNEVCGFLLLVLCICIATVMPYFPLMKETIGLCRDHFRLSEEKDARFVGKRFAVYEADLGVRPRYARSSLKIPMPEITRYYVTFQIQSVGIVEMSVPSEFYFEISEGAYGELLFRGKTFISFSKKELE